MRIQYQLIIRNLWQVSFANQEYPESIQQSSRTLFGCQETLDNISGTSSNPILVGETFEQV